MTWNIYVTKSALVLLLSGVFTARAAVLTVGQSGAPCPNAQYGTIGAAISSASPGDTIAICPALYPEQLVISMPLTLKGLEVDGVNRVLIQPASLNTVNGYVAAVSIWNTSGVSLQNLAIDASNNTVSCSPSLSTVHFFNSSGSVINSAISGALITNPSSCPAGPIGNGSGILVDSDGSLPGPFNVYVGQNSIHDYTKNGVYILGPGAGISPASVDVQVDSNAISGIGPDSGALQFGVFDYGAVAQITGNVITEGTCGSLSYSDCVDLRSEGVTLRAVLAGTVVSNNIIEKAQSGIFINGGTQIKVTNNVISHIDALDGIDIQGSASGFFTNSLLEGNTIFGAVPVDDESCGIFEYPGTGVAGNTIVNTTVNDAYCGVGYVTADHVAHGSYYNTLYTTYNADLDPSGPPPVEPALARRVHAHSRRVVDISRLP